MIYEWLDQYLNNLGVSKLRLGEKIFSAKTWFIFQTKFANETQYVILTLSLFKNIFIPPPPPTQYNPNDTVVSAMYCGISREVQILISQINLSGHTQSFFFAP